MMTAQDIRNMSFEKAVFGGYDMAPVDNYLESIAGNFEAMQKENETLRNKMKILVDKIQEYRETEDAMRKALLSAQKISAELTSEAQEKSDALLKETGSRCEEMMAAAKKSVEDILARAKLASATEDAKIVEAKRSSAQFIENIRLLCARQLDLLDNIDEIVVPPAPAQVPQAAAPVEPFERPASVDDTVKTIEDSVSKLVDEHVQDIGVIEEAGDAAEVHDSNGEPTRQFSPASEAQKNSFSFENLRFGE